MVFYSISRCRRVLRNGFKLLQKKGSRLGDVTRHTFEQELRALDQALLQKNKQEAVARAKTVESLIKTHFPKTFFDHLREIGSALVFALVVAFIIRQFWFELYQVPTGSMRPTVEELDRMVVSKTTFGITLPFRMRPLLFSDDYIRRQGAIVFTVQNMDMPDKRMLYFYLFPGYKRFIKRCVGKPGDTLYFYGGRIYGIDAEGNPLPELFDEAHLKQIGIERIEHIPFITFDGKTVLSHPLGGNVYSSVLLKQMNLPTGKLQVSSRGEIEGHFFNGLEWQVDRPEALKTAHDRPMSYSDLWGIGNFAMARLLTKHQVEEFYQRSPEEEALLYLELRHTPNLTYPKPTVRRDEYGRIHPLITPMVTLLPLQQDHLDALQNALFTARFEVKNGRAFRYQHEGPVQPPEFDPKFPNVPNGLYEFYYGKGYRVRFAGIQTPLPADHPLYDKNPENIQRLFNLGIHFNILFAPFADLQAYNPQRFAYFRDGDLYIMGAPIVKKDDPVLTRFVQQELEREKKSSSNQPYIAFVDRGAPFKNGELDTQFIRTFGLKVPAGAVVGLGDNYAMSADSRDFGFIPSENLRGSPSFIFWPPGRRVGTLPQPAYPWMTAPNLIFWTLALLTIISTMIWILNINIRSIFN